MRSLGIVLASLLTIVLVIGSVSCGGKQTGPSPVSTPTPTPAPVLFEDDFSNDVSGWDTYSDEGGAAFYQDGWLHVRNNASNEYADYSYSNQYFTDFVLVVETKLVDGTDDNWHVITTRDDVMENYYTFCISADGYYTMSKWVDGLRTVLKEPTRSIYVKVGKGVINIVRVECVGSDLSLSVNGHLLANVSDSTFTGGDIALGASFPVGASVSESQFTEVAFDNIIITAP
jgi:hypothetical protein